MAIKASESTVFVTKKVSFQLTPDGISAYVWHLNNYPPIKIGIDRRVDLPSVELHGHGKWSAYRGAIGITHDLVAFFSLYEPNNENFKHSIIHICKTHGYEWSIETTTREGGY